MSLMQNSKRFSTWLIFFSPLLVVFGVLAVRHVTSYFKTADLISAIEALDNTAIQKSLQEGANAKARTVDGQTMILWAIGNNGNVDAAKLLMKNGAQPTLDERLLIAAIEDDPVTLISALREGANIEAVEKDKWTALMWAAALSNDKAVKVLLTYGANVRANNSDGETVSEEACGNFGDQCAFDSKFGSGCSALSQRCSRTLQLLQEARESQK